MDKIVYELLNKGLDTTIKTGEQNPVTDISLTWDNEITICTEGGKVYILTIKESN